jgi:hypothetical protein
MRWDWPSIIPAIVAAAWLLKNPRHAPVILRRAWGAHLLNLDSLRMIKETVEFPS